MRQRTKKRRRADPAPGRPLRNGSCAPSLGTLSASCSGGTKGRVLVVDDEAGVREILVRLVRQEGYEALEAASGAEALATVRLESPDTMLLDITMPGLDGIEVLRRVKRLEPDLPVVVITSQVTVKGAVAVMRSGAHDYLAKPFEHVDVIRSLHSAVAERRQREALHD